MGFATWLAVEPGTEVLDLTPGLGDSVRALYASLWGEAGLDATVLERCRAAVEATLGTGAREDGDDADVATTAAVRFSEQYVVDAHGVSDAQAAVLHEHFTDPQLAAFTTALATFDALARVRAVLSKAGGTPATFTVEEG
jgi:alkylhydroperoxidase family enzyme